MTENFPLRILFVTEAASDIELSQSILQKSGLYIITQAVANQHDFAKALIDFNPQIIIAKYQLAQIDSLSVIKLAQSHQPPVPVIVFTEKADEEIAIQCLQAGAADCIAKQNRSRLPFIIKNTLKQQQLNAEIAAIQTLLQESEQKLHFYISNTSEGIWCFEPPQPIPLDLPTAEKVTRSFDAICIECNDAYAAMYGLKRSDLLGKKLSDLMPDNEINRAYLSAFFENGGYIENAESLEYDAQGNPRHILNSMYAEISEGKLVRAWGRQIDLTTQHNREIALQSTAERFRSIWDNSFDGMCLTNKQGSILQVNAAFCELIGKPASELEGMSLADIITQPAGDSIHGQHLALWQEGKKAFHQEHQITLWNGRRVWFEISSTVVKISDSEPLILSIYHDITERKRSEFALQEASRRFHWLYEYAPVAYHILNPDATILDVNIRWMELLGYGKEEVIGKSIFDFVLPEEREQACASFERKKQSGKIFTLPTERRYLTKNGEVRTFLIHDFFSYDDQKNLLAVQTTLQDITERKAMENALRESERKLTTLMGNIPGMVYRCKNDRDWTMEYLSPACLELTGYAPDDLLYNKVLSFNDLIDVNHRERLWQKWQEILPKHQIFEDEYPIITKDGKPKWVWEKGCGVYAADDTVIALEGIIMDITKRKQIEDALRESEAKFRALAESSPAAIFIYQNEYFAYVNPAAEQLTGYSAAELLQTRFWDVVHPAFRELVKERGLARQRGESIPSHYEFKIITKDRQERWVDFAGAMTNYQGKPAAIGFAYDVTERKQMEEDLLRSRSEWETIFRAIGHPTLILDPQHNILNANWAVLQKTGKTITDLHGHKCYEIFHKDKSAPPAGCPLTIMLASGKNEVVEMCMEILNGYYLVACTPVYDDNGNLARVIHVSTDITERKQAEEALIESEEKFRRLVENMLDLFFQIDQNGCLVYLSPAISNLLGYEPDELIGHSFTELILPDDYELHKADFNQRIANQATIRLLDLHLLRKDGNTVLVEISASPVITAEGQFRGYVGICRDVSLQRQMETERAKLAKLESLSILAGGIAHDFNNLLMGIMGNVSLARMKNKDSALEPILYQAERASLRTRDLTQQLLTFAKGGEPIKENVTLPELIQESAEFASRGSAVNLRYEFSENLPPALADRGQLSQVIQNLVLNAVQAMPNGGQITISVEAIDLADPATIPVKPGKYLRLRVRDTGTGIPTKIINRIFDPYFSTKQAGSGLGLAIVHSIISRHDGHIAVESQYGEGTTFTIYLPAGTAPEVSTTQKVYISPINGGKILLMDDEELVLEVGKAMLESLGYTVETAMDGKAAIDCYKAAHAAGEPFDAVIMDLTIVGGMGGQEAVIDLKRYDSNARVIVSSGYSNDPVMAHPQEFGFDGVVAKPYDLGKLSSELKRVLELKK